MSKTKELIICLISIVALILTITTNVFAQDINALLNDSTNNDAFANIEENNSTNSNNTATNSIKANTTNTNNTNVANNNVNKTATIPYTGIDYSVVVIIAICGISAVYAYKKIRDYNV